MSQNYSVQQGDHLAKIAKTFGFSDWQTIWKHPNNADLKNKRQNPNVLYPGDVLYIPDRQVREESCTTDKQHTFVKKTSDLKLRLTLRDQYEQPVADASCNLILGSRSNIITTDGNGKIEVDIQADDREGVLIFQSSETPFNNTPIPFRIGDLNPPDETSGQVARLNNLGYFAGDLDHPDPAAFQSAVEEFQCDNNLTVDGICGPVTQAKLKQEHGC
jgi:hypothetical protein